MYGFLGGTKGLMENKTIVITRENFKYYVNQGGFHYLGRTADKMRSDKDLESIKATSENLKLDGLVFVGASHTLTDCIFVSNYLLK